MQMFISCGDRNQVALVGSLPGRQNRSPEISNFVTLLVSTPALFRSKEPRMALIRSLIWEPEKWGVLDLPSALLSERQQKSS